MVYLDQREPIDINSMKGVFDSSVQLRHEFQVVQDCGQQHCRAYAASQHRRERVWTETQLYPSFQRLLMLAIGYRCDFAAHCSWGTVAVGRDVSAWYSIRTRLCQVRMARFRPHFSPFLSSSASFRSGDVDFCSQTIHRNRPVAVRVSFMYILLLVL
jgi:hypothetical protein